MADKPPACADIRSACADGIDADDRFDGDRLGEIGWRSLVGVID